MGLWWSLYEVARPPRSWRTQQTTAMLFIEECCEREVGTRKWGAGQVYVAILMNVINYIIAGARV